MLDDLITNNTCPTTYQYCKCYLIAELKLIIQPLYSISKAYHA